MARKMNNGTLRCQAPSFFEGDDDRVPLKMKETVELGRLMLSEDFSSAANFFGLGCYQKKSDARM
ncbi:hypothetical protein SLEP1_g19389 [Rubroshorea leprosula]|nr:hypothetical protein SLEP1_g19389 [Rubroshorea leprosula]